MKQTTGFVAAALAALGLLSAATAAVEGRVYLDTNRNGFADADEPGQARVLVSDGLHVSATDDAGHYRLETSDPVSLVWVSTPRDHAAAGPFWRAVESGARADFGLVEREQSNDFTFVQITDTHVGRDDLVKEFATHLMGYPVIPDFAVNTGDLVGGVDVVTPDKAQEPYSRYLGAAAAFKIPLYNIPGNHEHVAFNTPNPDAAHPLYGKGLYRKIFGPTYYSWEWAGVHFVALDGTSLPYQERLGTNQLAWLAADVQAQPQEKPLVLLCHQSLPALRDAKELGDILRGHRVLGAFCGHLHRTFTAQFAGFPVYHSGAMSGAWWSGPNIDGTPQGFRLTQIKGGVLKTVYASREGATPISVAEPLATTVRTNDFKAEVVVVDFGQPVELAASFDDQPVTLTQTSREDLWSVWTGTVALGPAFDGDRTLKIAAKQGSETGAFAIRYLVSRGRAEPYQTDASASLKLQVRGIDAPDSVLFNGEPLGVIPVGTTNEATVAFAISPQRLQKFNRVTVSAAAQKKGMDQFSVGPVWLEYKGKKIHDIRYASFERHTVAGDDPKRAAKELYYCLP